MPTGASLRSVESLSPRWKTCWTCTKRSTTRGIPPSAPIEKPVVLHADVQPPVPVAPGRPARVDYEYERRGTRNLFVVVEPLAGWRHVEVTARRTMQDYARLVRWLVYASLSAG